MYIDEYLDPHKTSYKETSISAILGALGISEQEYYWALSVSPDIDFEIHIFRPKFVFCESILQLVYRLGRQILIYNQCLTITKLLPTYMCSCFSKCETDSSVALKNAAKESENLSYQDRMKKLSIAFLTHRQCSLQEAVIS